MEMATIPEIVEMVNERSTKKMLAGTLYSWIMRNEFPRTARYSDTKGRPDLRGGGRGKYPVFFVSVIVDMLNRGPGVGVYEAMSVAFEQQGCLLRRFEDMREERRMRSMPIDQTIYRHVDAVDVEDLRVASHY